MIGFKLERSITRRLAICALLAIFMFVLFTGQSFAASSGDVKQGITKGDDYKAVRSETVLVSDKTGVLDSGSKSKNVKGEVSSKIVQASTVYWRDITYSVNEYSAAGYLLARFYHHIYWTYDGTYVLSVSRNAWGNTYFPGWEYVGIIGNSAYYFAGNTGYYSFYQSEFRFGSYGVYLDYMYPWLAYRIYGNGGYSISYSQ